jgi:leucyl/phenylalanyl-tRNA--protein transferase
MALPVIPVLGAAHVFPAAGSALKEGLVAVGGDLSEGRLLAAYRAGIFPWSVNPITWWSPDPRAVFDVAQVHVGRSLAKVLRKGGFTVTEDRCFRRVIEACATVPRQGDATWITPEIVEAYERMHELGWAHSLEVWQGGQLAGGVYGVAIGGFFAGESMFHHVSNASKVALVELLARLRARGCQLFDTQMLTETTRALGAFELPRAEYLSRLAVALDGESCWPCPAAAR